MKGWLLTLGLIYLIALEILRVYFIMPFPGSQQANTINIAYFIDKNIVWLRIIGIAVTILPLISILRNSRLWKKIVVAVVLIFYGVVFYMFNFKFLADKMFYQPKEKLFATAQADATAKTKLVIGVDINNQAKAYPLEIIGYHHQVKDTVGGTHVIVTYCTVCRTGRVYSPFINGKMENFRLVGMDHFNAMFEDATTKSWWRQESGEAIAGPLKGTRLQEIPSQQMALQAWVELHPNSSILQRDDNFKAKYDSLKGYDEGTIEGSLEHRDTASWELKSWVIGVNINNLAKAYDWNVLAKNKMIQDTIGSSPLLLTMSNDERSFYVLDRKTINGILDFSYDSTASVLNDNKTNSKWNINGLCVDGSMKGTQLKPVQSYQEFWHSWRKFHPYTAAYR